MYVLGMNEITNEEMLYSFTANSYPMMTDSKEKERLHKNTYEHAFPNEKLKPKNVVKLSDLGKVLNGR